MDSVTMANRHVCSHWIGFSFFLFIEFQSFNFIFLSISRVYSVEGCIISVRSHHILWHLAGLQYEHRWVCVWAFLYFIFIDANKLVLHMFNSSTKCDQLKWKRNKMRSCKHCMNNKHKKWTRRGYTQSRMAVGEMRERERTAKKKKKTKKKYERKKKQTKVLKTHRWIAPEKKNNNESVCLCATMSKMPKHH